MSVFEQERGLFRYTLNTPALEVKFQQPPQRGKYSPSVQSIQQYASGSPANNANSLSCSLLQLTCTSLHRVPVQSCSISRFVVMQMFSSSTEILMIFPSSSLIASHQSPSSVRSISIAASLFFVASSTPFLIRNPLTISHTLPQRSCTPVTL